MFGSTRRAIVRIVIGAISMAAGVAMQYGCSHEQCRSVRTTREYRRSVCPPPTRYQEPVSWTYIEGEIYTQSYPQRCINRRVEARVSGCSCRKNAFNSDWRSGCRQNSPDVRSENTPEANRNNCDSSWILAVLTRHRRSFLQRWGYLEALDRFGRGY